MKIFLVCIFSSFLFFSNNCTSQNLVPNPSFEDTLSCPTMGGQIYRALGWMNFGITPDYFNSCNGGLLGTPQNAWGNQVPINGNAYAGFACNASTLSNVREFIGCQLNQQLIIGETYYVSFYASLSDIPSGDCAINKIGVKFSTTSFDSINLPSLNNISHVYTNSIVSDTINWTKISGSFVADSSYNYLMLGNFFDDSQLDTLNCPPNIGTYSYYFFDLICVSPNPEFCDIDPLRIEKLDNINTYIKLYPNPADNIISIKSRDLIQKINLYSAQGKLQLSRTNINQYFINVPTNDFPPGFYIIQVYINQYYYNLKMQIVHQ